VPVFIELVTFDFERTFQDTVQGAVSKGVGGSSLAGKSSARRPVRGIEIKNGTYSYLKVVDASGIPIPIFDSSDESGMSTANSNFLVQSVQEGRAEKNQIVETFGDAYIFFFGENPRFIQVQGVLLNSNDFQWRTEWWANYNKYLRGTKLAEMGARLYLLYDDVVLEGYIMESQAQENSTAQWQVMFSFKMFVTNYQSVNMPGDPNFPVRASALLPNDVTLTSADSTGRLMELYRGDAATAAESDRSKGFTQPGGGLLQTAPDGRPSPYGSYKKLSDALRAVSRSVAFAPDVWKSIDGLPAAQRRDMLKFITREGVPLRSTFSNNLDEYVGSKATVSSAYMKQFYAEGADPAALSPATLNAQEADDMFQYAIGLLGQYGADVNNPTAMNDLGWGPSAPAPYGSQAPQNNQTSTIGPGGSTDPLGNVYGSQPSASAVSSDRSKYYEGSGNYAYGYASAYGGAGYGQAGFGDFGGGGFGSGLSSGDPGYRSPDKFSAAGVASAQSAYDRFVAKVDDDTSLTSGGAGISLGASASVGASMSFNEAPTAFCITSVEGTLDPSGSQGYNYGHTFVL
jgi:hypothetical protein